MATNRRQDLTFGPLVILCENELDTTNIWIIRQQEFAVNTFRPSGHYIYHQFNIHIYYVLPTQCIYVFCVDLRTNSDYFPIEH
jgi:hypothetical protein